MASFNNAEFRRYIHGMTKNKYIAHDDLIRVRIQKVANKNCADFASNFISNFSKNLAAIKRDLKVELVSGGMTAAAADTINRHLTSYIKSKSK